MIDPEDHGLLFAPILVFVAHLRLEIKTIPFLQIKLFYEMILSSGRTGVSMK